jgi:hypothetical protein
MDGHAPGMDGNMDGMDGALVRWKQGNPIPTMAILGNSWILKVLTLFGNFVLEDCFVCNGMFQSSLQVSWYFKIESSAKLTKGTV